MNRLALPEGPPDESFTKRLTQSGTGRPRSLIYEVELITPMFGGGVSAGDPDVRMPFRARSIKGHLRWWWRCLAEADVFDPNPLPKGTTRFAQRPLEQRRETEARLWGMLDSNRPLRSRVAVIATTRSGAAPCEPFPYQLKNGENELIENPRVAGSGYALFPAQAPRGGDPRMLVPAGERFTLEIRVDDAMDVPAVEQTVLAWATFGGIGARTRRGAGAVAVRHEGKLLCAFPNGAGEPRMAKLGLTVEGRGRYVGAAAPRVAFENPHHAWIVAVMRMKAFRQGPGVGRNGPRGRSRWPEADAVRRLAGLPHWLPKHVPVHTGGDHFPRVAFGMPLTIQFVGPGTIVSKGNVDQSNLEPLPRYILPPNGLADRMTSPLILRPVAVQVGRHVRYWAVAAVIERHPFRTLTTVRLRPQVEPPVADSSVNVWNAAWNVGVTGGCQGIPALERPATPASLYPMPKNAVEAFMNFFAEH